MPELPLKLHKRLEKRFEEKSIRSLDENWDTTLIDFYSNDYLGYSNSAEISCLAADLIKDNKLLNGATGSRLLSGNHKLYENAEELLAEFHQAEAALVFNSGYDANLGLFSCVPQKNDVVFYDELSHASIRDGLKMSVSKNYNFRHNDYQDLRKKLERVHARDRIEEVYVVTESVFSMDGDSADLLALARMAEELNFHLIIDEAHSTGVHGEKGQGLVQELELHNRVFARLNTFGKAMGAHGAVILGCKELRDYLINFCRSFIYTTALPPHSLATIISAYRFLEQDRSSVSRLNQNIAFFRRRVKELNLNSRFLYSDSPIQVFVWPGNEQIKRLSEILEQAGFKVKAILSPTVPKAKERLRFCIHTYNSQQQISEVLEVLATFVANEK